MKFKHLTILFAVVGTLLLYFISTLLQPTYIDINQAAAYDGKQVIVEGQVIEHHTTQYNGIIITIADNNDTTLIVFVEENVFVEYGDYIRATGTIQQYNDAWELVAADKNAITILTKWNDTTYPLWQLAENPSHYDGMYLTTSGIIERQYENYFYLTTQNGDYTITVYTGAYALSNLSQGDNVSVAGQFHYDPAFLRYTIELVDENHGVFTYKERG
jgi:hypothetical protein